ncbi:hypothetical protein HDU77_004748 [Chytriomyces hyalinus]|nr:hypothetical protein HDU77_004748 [Chytriomyces hyalinus]
MEKQDVRTLTIAIAITSVGLLLNAIVVLPNIWRLRSLPPSSVLIVFLCCSDSILLGNYLTLATTNLKRGNSDYANTACNVPGFMITFGALMSMGFCGGLTLFRYLIIVRKKTITFNFALVYLAGSAGVYSVVASLPILFQADYPIYILHPTHYNCTVAWFNTDTPTRVISVICGTALMIPMSSMGFAYYRIYKEVSKVFAAYRDVSVLTNDSDAGKLHASGVLERDPERAVEIKPAGVRVGHDAIGLVKAIEKRTATVASCTGESSIADEEAQVKETVQMSQIVTFKRRRRTEEEEKQIGLLIQSVAIVGLFVTGWTPYFILATYELISGTRGDIQFEFTAEMFLAMQDVLNPVVVLIFDEKVRRNVMFWRRNARQAR